MAATLSHNPRCSKSRATPARPPAKALEIL